MKKNCKDDKEENNEKKDEIKDFHIEKARKEVKDSNIQKSTLINMKIMLRKKDQEENLKRIQLQKLKEKNKLLDKIRDSDSLNKGNFELNLTRIYSQADE